MAHMGRVEVQLAQEMERGLVAEVRVRVAQVVVVRAVAVRVMGA